MGISEKFKEEATPGPTDLEGWRCAIDEGRLPDIRREALVVVIQDLGAHADPKVLNPLLRELSDHAMKLLRKNVGRNHPNEGQDIIDRAHYDLIEALFDPGSADGKGFRKAYYSRLFFRLKDAIGKEVMERRTEDDILAAKSAKVKKSGSLESQNQPSEDLEEEHTGDEDDLAELDASHAIRSEVGLVDHDDAAPTKALCTAGLMDGVNQNQEQIYVDRLLEQHITDPYKRFAYRLHMDGVPAKSKRTMSIASSLGIDESTARLWIEEVSEILKTKVEAKK